MIPGVENWSGLIFFLWFPILTALYFLNVKPKRKQVSSHFLWKVVIEKRNRDSLFEKFQSNLFYWLQLVFFLLLFMALSRPYFLGAGVQSQIVLIVDNSASMLAMERGSSRLQLAYRAAEKALVPYWGDAQVELIAWSLRPVFFSALPGLSQTLSQIQPTHLPNGSFMELQRVMRGLLAQNKQVIFVSDGMEQSEISELNRLGVAFILVGQNKMNVFLQQISQEEKSNQSGIRVHIGRSGPVKEALVQIRGKSSQELVRAQVRFSDAQRYDRTSVWLPLAPMPEEVLVEISSPGADALKEDSSMVFWPRQKKLGVEILGLTDTQSPLAQFVRRFVELDDRLEIVSPPARPDLKISDSLTSMDADIVFMGQSQAKNRFRRSFLTDPTSPITRYLQGHELEPADWTFTKWPGFSILALGVSPPPQVAAAVVLCEGNSGGKCILNIKDDRRVVHDLEFSILLENILQQRLMAKLGDDFLVTGNNNLDNRTYLHTPLLNMHRVFEDPEILDRVGVWEKDGLPTYVRIPNRESILRSGEDSVSPVWLSMQNRQSGLEEESREPIAGIVLIFGFLVLFLEWILFVRKT